MTIGVRTLYRLLIAGVLAAALLAGQGLSGSAQAAANTSSLRAGETLFADQRLVSPDGQYVLIMQGDGNLVLYAPGNRAVWATGTRVAGASVEMQHDGNLVVYAPGHVAVWATGTSGRLQLELQNDGNAVLYTDVGHMARWASADITDRNNTGQVRYHGYVLMRDNGWPDFHWSSLDALWTGESGWRWNATNQHSGAYGVPQALPPSKMAGAGADWRDNPGTQIRWGLQYIKQVYGSPQEAYRKWSARTPHWY